MNEPSEIQNKLAEQVMDCAFTVHRELGPGLLESVYEECLEALFKIKHIPYARQKPIPVTFMDKRIEVGFRADFIIDNQLIVELKTVDKLIPVHKAQVITYLKFTKTSLGLLINFNVPLLKDGIQRVILSQNP